MGGRGRPAGPENAPSLFEVKVLRNGRRPPQVTWTFLDQIPFPERRTNAHRHEQQQQQQEEDEEKMGGGGFARPRFDAGSALESLQRFSGPLAGKGKWKRRNAARANQPGPAVEDLSFPLPPPPPPSPPLLCPARPRVISWRGRFAPSYSSGDDIYFYRPLARVNTRRDHLVSMCQQRRVTILCDGLFRFVSFRFVSFRESCSSLFVCLRLAARWLAPLELHGIYGINGGMNEFLLIGAPSKRLIRRINQNRER